MTKADNSQSTNIIKRYKRSICFDGIIVGIPAAIIIFNMNAFVV